MLFNTSLPLTFADMTPIDHTTNATQSTPLIATPPSSTLNALLSCHHDRTYINNTHQPPAAIGGTLTEWMPYLEELNRRMNNFGTPTIIGIGCAGNILSVLAFFLTNLRKQSSSYYLAALGISDTCFLLITLMDWLVLYNINVYNQPGYCQTFTYLSGVFSFLSVWFVVGFTVERFIAVQYPLKRQTMCTVRRAKIVLVLMTVAACIMNAPLLVFSESVFNERLNGTYCLVASELKDEMRSFNYFDLVCVFVVPLLAILVLNSFIGYTVWSGAGLRRTMTTHKRSHPSQPEPGASITVQTMHGKRESAGTQPSIKSERNRRRTLMSSQMKVTKMLLIVSSVFVILNMPSYVLRVYAYYVTDESKDVGLLQRFTWYLYLVSFSMNFFLYCFTGQNFRKALRSLFRRPSIQRQDLETQATVTEYIRRSWFSVSRRRTHMQSV